MAYKVLTDGNGGPLVRIVGMGDYIPARMYNELAAERDRLVAQVKDMSELCLTTGEVNEIKKAAFVAGYEACEDSCNKEASAEQYVVIS